MDGLSTLCLSTSTSAVLDEPAKMAQETRNVSPKLDMSVLRGKPSFEKHQLLRGADDCDLAALPVGSKVVSVTAAGPSDFCKTFRIEVALPDQTTQVFFQKVGLSLQLTQSYPSLCFLRLTYRPGVKGPTWT